MLCNCIYAQSWEIVGKIPQMRMGAGVVLLNNKIYVIGGVKPPKYEPVTETDVYDLSEKKWYKKAHIPVGKALFSTVVYDNKIYVLGGNVYDRATTLEYDPARDTWTEKAPMPTPRQQLGAECFNGKIFTFGGSNGHNTDVANKFEVYNPLTNKWEIKSKMKIPLQNCATAICNKKIYAIAGHSIKDSENTGDLIMCLDPVNETWKLEAHTEKPKTDISSAIYNNKIFILGGHPGIPDVEVFNSESKQSAKLQNMPAGRWGHHSLAVGNIIYVICGTTDEIWSLKLN